MFISVITNGFFFYHPLSPILHSCAHPPLPLRHWVGCCPSSRASTEKSHTGNLGKELKKKPSAGWVLSAYKKPWWVEAWGSGRPIITARLMRMQAEAAQCLNLQYDCHFLYFFLFKSLCAKWNDNSLPLIEILIK